jgi:hypothetical protein
MGFDARTLTRGMTIRQKHVNGKAPGANNLANGVLRTEPSADPSFIIGSDPICHDVAKLCAVRVADAVLQGVFREVLSFAAPVRNAAVRTEPPKDHEHRSDRAHPTKDLQPKGRLGTPPRRFAQRFRSSVNPGRSGDPCRSSYGFDMVQRGAQGGKTFDIPSADSRVNDPVHRIFRRMNQIQMLFRGAARDDDPPVNRRVIGVPFADKRGKAFCGVDPVKQQLTLIVRQGSRRKGPRQVLDVRVHLLGTGGTRAGVARPPLRKG